MDFPTELQSAVENVVRLMVDKPEDVRVVPVRSSGIGFQIQVHPEDIGHVIGKQGRNARSLRILVTAMAQKAGRSVWLDIPTGMDA